MACGIGLQKLCVHNWGMVNSFVLNGTLSVCRFAWLIIIQQDACSLWDRSAKLRAHNWGMVNSFMWYIIGAVAARTVWIYGARGEAGLHST